jgi:hypothetical protein
MTKCSSNKGLGYGHTGSHFGYLTVAFYDPGTDWMVVSETTLYPGDHAQNQALGKAVVNLLKKMKQTLGY